MTRQRGIARLLKTMFDRAAATVLLVLLSPAILIIAGSILLVMGRPVLFRQTRPGYRGRPFTFLKFRTMRESRSPDGVLLADSVRLTPLGRLLRRMSLDEFPQLINIMRGELSFVGPRPLLPAYLDRYTPEQARRHDVIPGLTGWAQVNGRNALNWDQKFALDLWYVDHWSLMLDLRIMMRTLGIVIRGEGVTHPGESTMPEFLGSGSTEGQSRNGGPDHPIRNEGR